MRTILPCSPKDVANDAGLGSLSKMIGAVMHCISNSCRENRDAVVACLSQVRQRQRKAASGRRAVEAVRLQGNEM